MPHSQIKSFYSGMEIDDTRIIPKDKKKENDKKKKQEKKEPPKPKPPKTLEGAFEAVSKFVCTFNLKIMCTVTYFYVCQKLPLRVLN